LLISLTVPAAVLAGSCTRESPAPPVEAPAITIDPSELTAFAPLPDALLEERLVAAGRSPEAARLAVTMAGGSLGKALALDEEAMKERRAAVLEAAGLPPDDARPWIAFAALHGAKRERAREVCELLLVWLRDVLARAAAGEGAPIALADLEGATTAAARQGPESALRRIESVRRAILALRHNAAGPLTLERMLVGWFHG
jgi:DNA polymerase-3 subunit delta'